jgi:hypothetical protein
VDEEMELAQFGALVGLITLGFALFAFMFTRLERGIDRLEDKLDGDIKSLRRDLAEEFRAQRAEVAAQVAAIANAITAARREG